MRKMNIKILMGGMLVLSLFSITGCLTRLIDYAPLTVVYDLVPDTWGYPSVEPGNVIIENKEDLIECIQTCDLPLDDKVNNFDDSYFEQYYIIMRIYIEGVSGFLIGSELRENTIIFHYYWNYYVLDAETEVCFPIQIERNLIDINTLEYEIETTYCEDYSEFQQYKNIVNLVYY